MPTDASALLAHIVSQTRSNIDFLIAQHQISEPDGQAIISKLPAASNPDVVGLTQQTQRLGIASEPSPTSRDSPSPNQVARRGVPPPRRPVQVRALWSWNEGGQDPNDLSFKTGDIFEVITETNPDWWTGRHNGNQGLFPSNYVEKLDASSSPSQQNEKSGTQRRDFPPPSYHPQYVAPMGPPPSMGPPVPYQMGPPPNQQVAYNPYLTQPPGNVVPPAPEPAPEQPPKKSRFGGLGNTLAQSAVGGVGFGAGSAIGSDLIHSIF